MTRDTINGRRFVEAGTIALDLKNGGALCPRSMSEATTTTDIDYGGNPNYTVGYCPDCNLYLPTWEQDSSGTVYLVRHIEND